MEQSHINWYGVRIVWYRRIMLLNDANRERRNVLWVRGLNIKTGVQWPSRTCQWRAWAGVESLQPSRDYIM